MSSAEVIGARARRLDGHAKVTGQAVYPGDLVMNGMLQACILRSPHPHARIRGMSLAAARSLPGIACVLIGDDIGGPNAYGLITSDQPVLARLGGKVRYVGDAVAVVAAENLQTARAALDLIQVDYEPLPAVSDPRAAMAPGAPLVHDEWNTNILHHRKLRHGDLATGMAEADVIVESRYTTPFVDHAYLQPEAGLANMDESGRITVWVATQWPHQDLKKIAYALGLPEERLQVIQTTTGGAFGGREDISVQIVLALLALKTGRPVKMVYDRSESLLGTTKRHPFEMKYRTGATRDGRLTACEIEIITNAGAYASTSAAILETAVTLATGAYEIPHVGIDGWTVYTNTTPTAAMRGFGSNQPNFAAEMQMSKLADALGMDPIEFRRRNLYRNGSVMATGQVLSTGVGAVKALDAAAKQAIEIGIKSRQAVVQDGKRRGVGSACGFKNVGYNLGVDDAAGAIVEAYPDHAIVKVGACEVGQGSTTILAQLVATILELPFSAIQMIIGDTDRVPDSGSSSASRQTFVSGNAVARAAAEAAQRLSELGSNPPAGSLPVIAQITYHAPATTPMDPETGQSVRPNFAYGYGAHIVEVEVDTDTGEVQVLRAVAAHDVGRAINPTNVEGQIEGGFVMSQGYSLFEEYVLANGKPLTTTLATFLIPTINDTPLDIIPVIVEEPDPDGPFGAKGVGEMTMLPTPGAIGAAIHDAIGVWIDDLPFTPERILRALGKL